VDDDGFYDEHVSALEKAGYPVVTSRLHGPYDLGREIYRWEFATACAGVILKINPFDEPNVQEAKDNTKRLLERYTREKKIPVGERWARSHPELPSVLKDFLDSLKPGDYLGLNCFLSPSVENRNALQRIRSIILDRFCVATTLGFGPRYLHSSGQIHKGGPGRCSFVQITSEDAKDLAIPGKPYSFGVLKSAQALGDYQALKDRGRRIIRIHLASESDLTKLVTVFESI
jgi:hypothetical protein